MTTDHERLDAILANSGVSKTVHALVMPETEQTIDDILDGGNRSRIIQQALADYFNVHAKPHIPGLADFIDQALDKGRETLRTMYRESWTQKQDNLNVEFFDTWRRWVRPVCGTGTDDFPHMYPSSGATEGLRAAIEHYGASARKTGQTPVIHVFNGEYEGFAAAASHARIAVKTHDRQDWRAALAVIGPEEQFYISQPSSIDGNVWDEFDDFAMALRDCQPSAQIMLDLTYVGCVARPFTIDTGHANIPTLFFSLSKPEGANFHRIGGCLSRVEYPALSGNKWMKNILALRLGTEMMKRYDVFALPRRYTPFQEKALETARATTGLDLRASDVYLTAIADPSQNPSELESYLTRGDGAERLVRVCLTPSMAVLINPLLDRTVRSRPHEVIPAP